MQKSYIFTGFIEFNPELNVFFIYLHEVKRPEPYATYREAINALKNELEWHANAFTNEWGKIGIKND